jgi:hypothetical protein
MESKTSLNCSAGIFNKAKQENENELSVASSRPFAHGQIS